MTLRTVAENALRRVGLRAFVAGFDGDWDAANRRVADLERIIAWGARRWGDGWERGTA